MAAKGTDWRPGPAVCRCCFAEGCYKDISTEYFWMGKREVYSEMLSTTFDVSIAYSQSTGPNSNSRLICEPCISRLRDASDFKRQVVECEKTFMQHLDPGSSNTMDLEIHLEAVEKEEVKLERVKVETKVSDDEFDDGPGFPDDDDDDLDDEPLTKLASKVPKKETVDFLDLLDNSKPEKRKATTKPKAPPAKKPKKREAPKASASKPPAKPEKKKKEPEVTESEDTTGKSVRIKWKRLRRLVEDKANAAFILEHSNAVAFRWFRGKFMCAYCPTVCPNVTEVRNHTIIHDNRNVFKNPNIRNSFPLRVDITDLSCSLCNERVETLKNLKGHLMNNHSKCIDPDENYGDGVVPYVLTGTELKCVLCGELFESFMSLILHMNSHYQDYVCHTCGKGFSGKHKLRTHRMNHESGQFSCLKCGLVFTNRMARSRHTYESHGPKERHRCPICEDRFDSYHARLRHLERVHGQKSEYKCSLCPSVFGTGSLRYSHLRTVHKRKRVSNLL